MINAFFDGGDDEFGKRIEDGLIDVCVETGSFFCGGVTSNLNLTSVFECLGDKLLMGANPEEAVLFLQCYQLTFLRSDVS